MKEPANRLKYVILEEEPENIKYESDKDGNIIAHVAVTVDSTWQKQGHSSKIGVAFAMSVIPVKIINENKTEYIEYSEKHSFHCYHKP